MSLFSRLFRAASPAKPAAAPKPAPSPATNELRLRITRIVRETEDAATLTLTPLDGRPLLHQPGQYLSLRFELSSGPVWRAYSICTPPGAEVSVTVKRVAGGLVSTHVVERAREGDELLARGPQGSFVIPDGSKRLFFIAGGSGITPVMSQLQSALASAGAPLTLLYGNRSEQDIIFREQLEALCAAHPSLRLRHVLSEPRAGSDAISGILDEPTVSAQLRQLAVEPGDFDAFLLCGPEPMMHAARRALLAHGVPDGKILEERFTTTASARSEAGSEAAELRFVHEGETQVVTVEAGETLLETTQRLNLPLDFSCMAGQCGTCMIKLDAGDVEMEEPNILTDAQKKRGLILACVSRPRSACTVSTIPPGR